MPTSEDRLEAVERTLNRTYSDIATELAASKGLTTDAVKRLASQQITLDEHAQILRDHTARLERIETMLTQIITHLKETPSATRSELSNTEPAPPEPEQQRRARTFMQRALGIFPDETKSEKL